MINSCDTKFAHAVRRAATGFRPKAKVDLVAETEPLRTVLCSDHPLDPHGLELLALAVTGNLRKLHSQPKGETMFALAVRRASAAWRPAKLPKHIEYEEAEKRRPCNAGTGLAIMLRSGKPALGAGEREFLAELFAPIPPTANNELQGRPGKGAGHTDVVKVVDWLRNELASGVHRKEAIYRAGQEYKISKRTVERYEAMVRERHKALTKAQNTNDKE